ncbi:MAG TPA: NAD(P)-dependent alcohol dehydrogenase [Mycobacterium sp.]|nr:MAG: NAD(P)-dependent alcohol dehydrogenase [Mycobacterium sp.]HOB50557.1 NAD(P)-dependent alcohol dehydrogenase [Mycobacterium sp.]HQE16468.1 NAD(P)-dependent alcohol dehydrogenase [Mycobacterium sp.]
MRALQMVEFDREPELREIPDPTPGPGEVVVKVGAAGACHSDLHILYELDVSAMWRLPMTLGHETAGWVHALGSGVTGLSEGDPVAVYGAWGCGVCARCAVGMENYCERPTTVNGGGLGANGGMADYLLVPHQRHLVPLPDGLDPVTAAPLTDAGLTPYHAIRRSWSKLTPDATIVVIGVGGLGHVGVQIARATTAAQVVAVDVKDAALDLAQNVGAHHAVHSDSEAAQHIRDLTGGRGADVVIDFVGATPTMELALAAARGMADVTIVGIGGGQVPLSFFSQPYEVSIATTYWGSRPELVELLALAATGQVSTESSRYTLDEGVQAYRDLRDGRVTGRAVVVP